MLSLLQPAIPFVSDTNEHISAMRSDEDLPNVRTLKSSRRQAPFAAEESSGAEASRARADIADSSDEDLSTLKRASAAKASEPETRESTSSKAKADISDSSDEGLPNVRTLKKPLRRGSQEDKSEESDTEAQDQPSVPGKAELSSDESPEGVNKRAGGEQSDAEEGEGNAGTNSHIDICAHGKTIR